MGFVFNVIFMKFSCVSICIRLALFVSNKNLLNSSIKKYSCIVRLQYSVSAGAIGLFEKK